MDKIIIGIHGLGNKPPKDLLQKWWQQSIAEGLKNIGRPGQKFNFDLVYWADSLHPVPLNPDETDEDNDLYLSERYVPAEQGNVNKPNGIQEKFINFFQRQRNKILFSKKMHVNFPSFTDLIIKHFFKDLDIYLTQKCVEENKSDCLAKDIIRDSITNALKQHKRKDILLIAHSMGSIVTYEALIKSEKEIEIDSLITIGSPIGVPYIFNKLNNELSVAVEDNMKLRTPENILIGWENLADIDDKVAQSADLRNLFSHNSHNVSPAMILVDNDYQSEGIENPHKSYGYLRTPEIAYIIDDFLYRDKNKFILWLTRKFDKIKYKFTKAA
ncbi:MAG: hypothetical protein WBH40_18460 [Ignavibacteriaceae bacterium]